MQSEVNVRMRLGIVGHLRKPWARHHQARRINRSALNGLDGRGIDRVRLAKIVGVNDDEFCAGRVTEAISERLRGCLRRSGEWEKKNKGQRCAENKPRGHR